LPSSPVALLISIFFPPEIGGGSTGAWNRATVLHKLGYSVFVLCSFPCYPTGRTSDPKYKGKFFVSETLEHFTVIRLRLLPIEYTGFLKRLIIFLNFILLTILLIPVILKSIGKVDLVYARAPILFSSIIGLVYSAVTKGFFIYEAPDLWPEELVAFRTPLLPIIMKIGKLVAKFSYDTPDVVLTISDRAANYISSNYSPKSPVYGIPVGVDPSKFPRLTKDSTRRDLIKSKIFPPELLNKCIVLYSGLISEAQHVENLAHAAKNLTDEKDIAIVIVGEGPNRSVLERLKIELNLDNFYLFSAQPRIIMPKIISAADICTILLSSESIFEIALPTKFYEYIACTKPLIGICRGELANIINLNNIGFSLEFGDIEKLVASIRKIKNCPEIVQIFENNLCNTLQDFALESVTEKFSKILDQEIKTNRLSQRSRVT
jgi:glycosyltransferase involved in cell wall biosynthesis